MAVGPCGRPQSRSSLAPSAPSSAPPESLPDVARGSRFRRGPPLALRPGRGAGCDARRSPGNDAKATSSGSMAARLRKEANRGGCRRAVSTRARMYGSSVGPSVTRPPDGVLSPAGVSFCVVAGVVPLRPPPARRRASARTAFISGGYAAASSDLAPLRVPPVRDGRVAVFAVCTHRPAQAPEVWGKSGRVRQRGALARGRAQRALGERRGLRLNCLQRRSCAREHPERRVVAEVRSSCHAALVAAVRRVLKRPRDSRPVRGAHDVGRKVGERLCFSR
eukprot:3592342-Pleurochrysis_carterae.AAC.1